MNWRPRWDPTGRGATVASGIFFGSTSAVVTSVLYGSWWNLLWGIPLAVAWVVVWPRAYAKALDRVRRRSS